MYNAISDYKEMSFEEALKMLKEGALIRNENFAAGTFCVIEDGNIWDPEAGYVTEVEFREFYKHFPTGWYIAQ